MNKTTYIVDDEKKALAQLRRKLEEYYPQLEILGENQNPLDAIEEINEKSPDLIFLDITMPQISGMELLDKIKQPSPEVIFVTAYDDYAIEALNKDALGYILKPIDESNFQEIVNHALEKIEHKRINEANARIIESFTGVEVDRKLVIPTAHGFDLITMKDILYCEGKGGYTSIHSVNGDSQLSSKSIGFYNNLLECGNFFQVHKSYIINLNYVTKYFNEGTVVLQDKIELPISKNRKNDFINLFK